MRGEKTIQEAGVSNSKQIILKQNHKSFM